MLAVCGFGLVAVPGCLSQPPSDEAGSSETDAPTPSTDMPSPSPNKTLTSSEETVPPSSSPTPSAPLIGGTVSAEPGDSVEVPFVLTNTGSAAIDPDSSRVLDVDLAYFPDLHLTDDAGVPGTWADDFEDVTAWTPPDSIEPGETVTARLPVAIEERARGLYALRGRMGRIDATGTALIRVSSVPEEPAIALRAQGGLGGFTSTGPPGSAIVDEPVCPADTARVLCYLRNVTDTAVRTVDLTLTLPEGWDVGEVTHVEQWHPSGTRWRFRDVAPGRYRWSRVDLHPPSDISERGTYRIDATGGVTTGTERTASATVVADPNKDRGLTSCTRR